MLTDTKINSDTRGSGECSLHYQMNELSLDLMQAVAFKHQRVVRLPVHAEGSQKSFCYGGKQ